MTKQKAKQTKKSRAGLGVRKDAPAASSRRVMTSPSGPSIIRSSSGCRIKHREFMTSIVPPTTGVTPYTGTFYCRSWLINPGLSSAFPWLAPIANQYELYRFHSLKFRFVTRSGTSTGGAVRMAFDHDAMDEDPSASDVVMSYAGATSDVVWKDQTLEVPVSRLNLGMPNGRYTRMGIHPLDDLKTYDAGKFILALSGWGGIQELGELHIEYDVELLVPQLRTGSPSGVLKTGTENRPTSSPLDLRVLAVVDRLAAAVGGSLPAEVSEQTNPVTGEIVNLIKFVAPFVGEIMTDIRGAADGSDVVPAASLSIQEDPTGTSAIAEKLGLRAQTGGGASRTLNRWLGDIKAGTVLKLARAGPYLGNTIAAALLAFKLLDKASFPKYEI